ncbi:MAG: nucleoside deaminase [Caldiserica bacterium]|nr:nucleoside deaminase [Caldisericota bacterium]MDH7563229.1 nucleoside deaminase [Caldisericota bacterium]
MIAKTFLIMDHERFMKEALKEAEAALERGDRPIGAVIVHENKIIGRGSNGFATRCSDISHAELNALLSCAPQLQQYGHDCVLYTTCEPCVMCLGAIVMANIRYIVYGIPDNYIRARTIIETVDYIKQRIHGYLGGILEEECVALYRRFSEKEVGLCLHGRS